MAILNFGTHINSVFAIEGRLGLGVGDDTQIFTDVPIVGDGVVKITGEIDSYYGIFARVGIPNLGAFYPYIIAGFGKTKIESSADGFIDSDESGSDTAFGIGANVNFGETISGNLEYMNYYDKNDYEVTGVSFSLNYNF